MNDRTLSSTAFRTYWLGRYLERISSTARLVLVNANLLIDLPMRVPLGWLPLIEILALEEQFEALYGEVDPQHNHLDAHEKSVVRFLLSDTRNSSSLMNALSLAKENARTLRGTLPRAAYEYINEAHLYAKEALTEPLSRSRRNTALQKIIEHVQQIDGFLSATMLHDANWQFLRLGNFVERADMTTRIIDLRTINLFDQESELEPFADIQWRSVMNSLDAMQSYTTSVQSPINQESVLEFLLKDSELPRSLLRCFNTIRNCLRALPENQEPLEHINRMRRQLQRARIRPLNGKALSRFVDLRQRQISNLHQKITDTYFPLR